MSEDKEAHEQMYEIAMLLDGMFDDMYCDTSLRLRPIPKAKKEDEDERRVHTVDTNTRPADTSGMDNKQASRKE